MINRYRARPDYAAQVRLAFWIAVLLQIIAFLALLSQAI